MTAEDDHDTVVADEHFLDFGIGVFVLVCIRNDATCVRSLPGLCILNDSTFLFRIRPCSLAYLPGRPRPVHDWWKSRTVPEYSLTSSRGSLTPCL